MRPFPVGHLDCYNNIAGFPFVGLLFTGFMITPNGPKVLEYNVRFGDPETEALMLLLPDDTDLASILVVSMLLYTCSYVFTPHPQACAERRLDAVQVNIRSGSAVSVILASHGYPGSYSKGHRITIDELPPSMYLQKPACRQSLIAGQRCKTL